MTQEEKKHLFWSTQPLGKEKEDKQKYSGVIPEGYSIRSFSPKKDIERLHTLLCEHYVEDTLSMFRFKYTKEFLLWQLTSPSVYPDWNVVLERNNQMIGFISAADINISIRQESPKSAVVNFLCIHKEYRKKRLAPLLIQEITRRVNEKGTFKALFTAGESLPNVFAKVSYYHRILKNDDLVERGFCDRTDIEHTLSTPNTLLSQNILPLRVATPKDIPQIYELYQKEYQKLDLYANLSLEQFAYYHTPREGVVLTLVPNDLSGFISVFFIDTLVVEDNTTIRTVYLYHYATHDYSLYINSLISYLKENTNCNVLNTLALHKNTPQALESLGFLKGDGILNYYLFNWQTDKIVPEKNGFVSF
ncbi:glycylpeptide N-tetradecanoyltransferase [Nematocida sp. AWRm80]|nr:glycylpeptide N-tetradecanoyltransferase [Nematocida sp. AWRm80]